MSVPFDEIYFFKTLNCAFSIFSYYYWVLITFHISIWFAINILSDLYKLVLSVTQINVLNAIPNFLRTMLIDTNLDQEFCLLLRFSHVTPCHINTFEKLYNNNFWTFSKCETHRNWLFSFTFKYARNISPSPHHLSRKPLRRDSNSCGFLLL